MNKIYRSVYFWEALSFTVAVLGSFAMDESSMRWYAGLSRYSLTPPDFIFPAVWITLYAIMGYAAYRVASYGNFSALLPYIFQLIFNLAWSWIFFYFKLPPIALADLIILVCMLIWTIAAFFKHDRIASLLLIPYLAWGIFAFWLNLYIVIYN
jgi:tryptophan-rich sensory protein